MKRLMGGAAAILMVAAFVLVLVGIWSYGDTQPRLVATAFVVGFSGLCCWAASADR